MSNISGVCNKSLLNETTIDNCDENIYFALGITDCIIVLIYLIGSVSLGVYVGRKHKTAEDYFLAGRSMTWPFVGLSLFASNVSSSSLIGLTGSAYERGISVYNYVWISVVILIVFGTFFLPSILKSEIHTLPELLELRYNGVVRYYFSLLSIILTILGSTGQSLYGGALVVKMIFPQLEIWHNVVILAVIAGVYTVFGGLVAVIYTDTMQAVAMVLGSAIISGFTLYEVGGWGSFKSQVPPEHLSLVQPLDDPSVPWTGVLFGIPIISFHYWCANQSIVQRTLSSKDLNHGRWGCFVSGLFNLLILFIIVFPGAMGNIIFKDLPEADLVYPKLMFTLLPVGALGIVLSGFIAALLSDIDSDLNSMSTLITMDFAKKFKPNLTEGKLMKIGQVVTFIVTVLAATWAPFIGNFGSLYRYAQKLVSYLTPPVVALYVVGFFWKGATAGGAMIMLMVGNIVCVVFFIFNEVINVMEIHFLHVVPILFLCNVITLIGGSLVLRKQSEDQLKNVWSSQALKEEIVLFNSQPFWKNYHLLSLLLVISTAVLVGLFW